MADHNDFFKSMSLLVKLGMFAWAALVLVIISVVIAAFVLGARALVCHFTG